MTQQDKRRLTIVGAIFVAAVVLWLLLRRSGANTIIQNTGDLEIPGLGGGTINLGSLPPLNYSPGDYNSVVNDSAACTLCYSGYTRLETPTPALPPAQPATIIKYLAQRPALGAFAMFNSPAPAPAPSFWNVTGRFF